MRLMLAALAFVGIAGSSHAHGLTDVYNEALLQFSRENPMSSGLSQQEMREYVEAQLLFADGVINGHLNTDWRDESGLLDSFLALVNECEVPQVICDDWDSGKYRSFYKFGEPYVAMRILSDIVPSVGSELPHRCEAGEGGFVAGRVLSSESYNFVMKTKKNDAAYPCYIQSVGN